jgi:hypothetical protein
MHTATDYMDLIDQEWLHIADWYHPQRGVGRREL